MRASLGLACAQGATLCTQVVGQPRSRSRARRPVVHPCLSTIVLARRQEGAGVAALEPVLIRPPNRLARALFSAMNYMLCHLSVVLRAV